MTHLIAQEFGDGECECAACGSISAEPMARVFCPECATDHACCSGCANDAAEALAA